MLYNSKVLAISI